MNILILVACSVVTNIVPILCWGKSRARKFYANVFVVVKIDHHQNGDTCMQSSLPLRRPQLPVRPETSATPHPSTFIPETSISEAPLSRVISE